MVGVLDTTGVLDIGDVFDMAGVLDMVDIVTCIILYHHFWYLFGSELGVFSRYVPGTEEGWNGDEMVRIEGCPMVAELGEIQVASLERCCRRDQPIRCIVLDNFTDHYHQHEDVLHSLQRFGHFL